ncbi:MAG: hypothetical protein QM611_06060 [Microbacterium sp.]
MTEPQAWTLIGVFAAIMLGGMTLTTTLIMHTMRAEIGGLRGEMRAEVGGLRGEMNARFDAVDTRIDHLDRDITALTRRVWGDP